jgi:hypothetical protein
MTFLVRENAFIVQKNDEAHSTYATLVIVFSHILKIKKFRLKKIVIALIITTMAVKLANGNTQNAK